MCLKSWGLSNVEMISINRQNVQWLLWQPFGRTLNITHRINWFWNKSKSHGRSSGSVTSLKEENPFEPRITNLIPLFPRFPFINTKNLMFLSFGFVLKDIIPCNRKIKLRSCLEHSNQVPKWRNLLKWVRIQTRTTSTHPKTEECRQLRPET